MRREYSGRDAEEGHPVSPRLQTLTPVWIQDLWSCSLAEKHQPASKQEKNISSPCDGLSREYKMGITSMEHLELCHSPYPSFTSSPNFYQEVSRVRCLSQSLSCSCSLFDFFVDSSQPVPSLLTERGPRSQPFPGAMVSVMALSQKEGKTTDVCANKCSPTGFNLYFFFLILISSLWLL